MFFLQLYHDMYTIKHHVHRDRYHDHDHGMYFTIVSSARPSWHACVLNFFLHVPWHAPRATREEDGSSSGCEPHASWWDICDQLTLQYLFRTLHTKRWTPNRASFWGAWIPHFSTIEFPKNFSKIFFIFKRHAKPDSNKNNPAHRLQTLSD